MHTLKLYENKGNDDDMSMIAYDIHIMIYCIVSYPGLQVIFLTFCD